MRFFNNQHEAAGAMPFDGLGLAMDCVRTAAQMMTPVYHDRAGSERSCLPVADVVWQPSGYALLVALGREIRGR